MVGIIVGPGNQPTIPIYIYRYIYMYTYICRYIYTYKIVGKQPKIPEYIKAIPRHGYGGRVHSAMLAATHWQWRSARLRSAVPPRRYRGMAKQIAATPTVV
jgi:hypothetical protein